MRRRRCLTILLLWLVAFGLLAAGGPAAGAAPSGPTVLSLKLSGVVDPFMASYLKKGIAKANADRDAAVLITIDTPGGLDSSMRDIVKAILASRIPVICYTSPPGARAASAGTFVMMACPVSAMAPGTNIGAAHPVGVSGAIEQAKVTNDAAAFIASLADRWGRNADWAKKSVRNATSVTAETAVKINAVDLLATSTDDLISNAGGCFNGVAQPQPPSTGLLAAGGPLTSICGATVVPFRMGIGASILHNLISPDLAFIFFYAGLVLIVIELLHPGVSIPGILGTLMLVLAFISFGMLPVQLAGVVLLVASAVFFLFELKHPGLGLPTVGGLVCLILGGLVLFDPSVPNARVSLGLIAGVAIMIGLFFVFVVRAVVDARRMPRPGPGEQLLGALGVARTDLAPRGEVQTGSESWSAESAGGAVPAGTPVRVLRVEGLRLIVEAEAPRSEASSDGEEAGSAAAGSRGGHRT